MKKRFKIAIVDDNDFHALLMKKAIEESDCRHEIFLYHSGGALLKEIICRNIDIVITELTLPDIDGIELVHQIKNERPHLPIMIVTANGTEQAAVQAMDAGAIDFIIKRPGYITHFPVLVEKAYKKHKSQLRLHRREVKSREAEKLEMITALVSTLNHEINNPLMAILGNVELLLKKENLPQDKVKQKLKMIVKSTRRIEQITKRMENLISTSVRQTPVGPMLKLKGRGASRFRKPVSSTVSE